MPLSNDPEARAKQLANIQPNAATRHGAWSAETLAPLRERYSLELAATFPSASSAEIGLLAHRQAQLDVLAGWMDRRGLFSNKQRGHIFPAVDLHNRIANSFERQYDQLRQREQATGNGTSTSLAAIVAELTSGEEQSS